MRYKVDEVDRWHIAGLIAQEAHGGVLGLEDAARLLDLAADIREGEMIVVPPNNEHESECAE